MSFNKDELVAPDWMNSDFLKQVLECSEKCETIKIIDYKMSPATMLGDHFASIMFRANINYSTSENPNANISIIIKSLPVQEGPKKDMLGKFVLFETEIFMYSKILPTCKEIVRNVGYKGLLAPKMLYHSLEPRKVIVFEDLKELGYSMYSEFLAKENDLKKVFGKVAQVHASTFKMEADGNKEIRKLRGTCFGLKDAKNLELFNSGLSDMLEAVEKIPGLELCVKKLKQCSVDALLDKCIGAVNIPGSYNVLNHGDIHMKNMMFKSNEDKDSSEIVLVDFQICHWGSPAHDLLYLACAVPFEYRDEIFKYYFNTFIDILNKSGYKGKLPSYAQLEEELVKNRHIEIFIISSFAPFIGMEVDILECDLETLMTSKDSRSFLYKSEKYVSLLKKMLPNYLEHGYFDDIIIKEE